jgi:hypothetical protein
MRDADREAERERIKHSEGHVWTNRPNLRLFVRTVLGRSDDDS